jgi:hypothetical protein
MFNTGCTGLKMGECHSYHSGSWPKWLIHVRVSRIFRSYLFECGFDSDGPFDSLFQAQLTTGTNCTGGTNGNDKYISRLRL